MVHYSMSIFVKIMFFALLVLLTTYYPAMFYSVLLVSSPFLFVFVLLWLLEWFVGKTGGIETRKERYRHYLHSSEWKEKRNTILKMAGYRCRDCKKKRATQVHHERYVRLYNEKLTDLTALCGQCHRMRHHN